MTADDPTLDERVTKLETSVGHYVHGRGWWARLIAWIVVLATVSFILYRQQHVIATLKHDRNAACHATLTTMEGVQALAIAGIVAPIAIPPNSTPEVRAALENVQRTLVAANSERRKVFRQVEVQEATFVASDFCNGIVHLEPHNDSDLDTAKETEERQ